MAGTIFGLILFFLFIKHEKRFSLVFSMGFGAGIGLGVYGLLRLGAFVFNVIVPLYKIFQIITLISVVTSPFLFIPMILFCRFSVFRITREGKPYQITT
jgi:hypothetical protein